MGNQLNVMDCENSLCNSTRKGLYSIQKEFTCAICHELFVRAHTLSCSHSYCERCIISWLKKNQECPTCRKPIEGKPVHSIALDNAVGKLVDMRVESFAERSRMKDVENKPVTLSVAKQADCGTQTTFCKQSRESSRNNHGGACVRHFFHSQNGGPCHEFHFFDAPHREYSESEDDYYDSYDDDDYYDDDDDYYDDDNDDDYYEDYNGLPGYYWGGYGTCFNCGKYAPAYHVSLNSPLICYVGDPFHWANGCPRW